jgi:hypothetical protein
MTTGPEIIVAEPPLIDEIDEAFDVRGKPILFAWGRRLYAPHSTSISVPLLQHEAAHGLRQLNFPSIDVDLDEEARIIAWWRLYICDPHFRLEEEKWGHLAEYRSMCRTANRDERRKNLAIVAAKMSAPLYRYNYSNEQARRFLVHGFL